YIADLHSHSLFSRATSKESDLKHLFSWAKIKGINVVGTGDFTHPKWFKKIKEELRPAEPGFLRLRDENVPLLSEFSPQDIPVRFVLTTEISCIYKKNGRVRKIHNIILSPNMASAENFTKRLSSLGNIEADGRPIIGMDAKDLLELFLEEIPYGIFVPAHIWTPWFSLFGSKSGFDSIEECFGELTEYIFALETGLSSDPAMNRLLSSLDRFTLISNSDCHHPSKLGREANLFETDFDFYSMKEAIKHIEKGFLGTIEFFPQEGKYHLDGHRKCGITLEPEESIRLNEICPVCGEPLTIGVMHRVLELADRDEPYYPEGSPPFKSLIPLTEVLGEIMGLGPSTKGVMAQYRRLISKFGSEFKILMDTPIEELSHYDTILSEAIDRIRKEKVYKKPGYDGVFGKIRVFQEDELTELLGQYTLFKTKKERTKEVERKSYKRIKRRDRIGEEVGFSGMRLNEEQLRAVYSKSSRIVVSAGPGTGKTFTLIQRIIHLIKERNVPHKKCTVITFTNKAADEVRQRLRAEIGEKVDEMFVGTFHNFSLSKLRQGMPELKVINENIRREIAKEYSLLESDILDELNNLSMGLKKEDQLSISLKLYIDELRKRGLIELDYIIPLFVKELREDIDFYNKLR
ncbi:MAG: DNA helicase II, partial [Nitrospirae bacterium]